MTSASLPQDHANQRIAELVAAFEAGTLAPNQFDHHAHITVALWYLAHLTLDEAIATMRSRIQQFAARHHHSHLYNETITRFWLYLLRHLLDTAAPNETLADVRRRAIDTFGTMHAFYCHYSKERALSESARHQWVEPDLLPLPLEPNRYLTLPTSARPMPDRQGRQSKEPSMSIPPQPPTWNEQHSQLFIDYGRYFVPERELQYETICTLLDPPIGTPPHIIDLCCGQGLLAEMLLNRFPESIVHGFDGSPTMLQAAQERLAHYGERFQPMHFDLAATPWRTPPWQTYAVVSSLAIHHLDAHQKQQLFRDIHHLLIDQGMLVIADLIAPAHQRGIALAAQTWDSEVHQRALTIDGTTHSFEYFQHEHWNLYAHPDPEDIDKPSGLFEQLQWLAAAGFVAVDAYWMKAGHVIYGGSKAAYTAS